MATVLKAPPFGAPPLSPRVAAAPNSLNFPKPLRVCCRRRVNSTRIARSSFLRLDAVPSLRFVRFLPLASSGRDTETAETQEQVQEPDIEDSSESDVSVEDGSGDDESSDVEEVPSSPIIALMHSYKEALASNDESKVSEIEAYLKAVVDEKVDLEKKVASLSEELSIEKERILRISADFDNFRKRTERDRLSLVTNAQGEVLENLLPVLDNFERAKAQIKVETEGEEKINKSYQSIYKQFVEILGSLGVVPVEPVGNPFDPMLHEAIMNEESTEFEEGIIIDEFRKGFKIGDRLLRPSMVKVSAGPGPAKTEQVVESSGEEDVPDANEGSKTTEGSDTAESSAEAEAS